MLSEIWSIVRQDGSVPVWLEPRLDSPLATVGERIPDQDGILHPPKSTVTVRMRWRNDIAINDRLIDPNGDTWFVNETLQVGRRRWLDAGLSTYQVAAPATPQTLPPARAEFDPPSTWPFTLDGLPLERLTIATIEADGLVHRQGTFAPLAGTLAGTSRHVGSNWFQIDRTRNIGGFLLADQNLGLHLSLQYLDLEVYSLADDFGSATRLRNSEVPLGPGDVLRMLSDGEAATWLQ